MQQLAVNLPQLEGLSAQALIIRDELVSFRLHHPRLLLVLLHLLFLLQLLHRLLLDLQRVPSLLLDVHHFESQLILLHHDLLRGLALQKLVEIADGLALLPHWFWKGAIIKHSFLHPA